MPHTVSNNVVVKLLCLTLHGLAAVMAKLPGPTNVRINSVNMGLLLEWTAPENQTENITYRAEYRPIIQGYKVVCLNTTAHSCDFTPQLTALGVYRFQVRAERDGYSSPWVNTEEFVMDEHTNIGPPNVTLVATGTKIDVNIQDPVFRISKFRDIYNWANFSITYWKVGQEEKARNINSTLSKVVLDLEPLSHYCFQVGVITQRFVKRSQLSNVTCESTANAEHSPWLLVFGVTVLIAVAVLALVLVAWCSYRLVSFLGNKPQLPEHFTEQGSSFLAMHKSPEPDEMYHEVSILSVEKRAPSGGLGEANG